MFGNENVATSASSTASLDYIVVVGIEWVFSLAACTIGILIAAVGGGMLPTGIAGTEMRGGKRDLMWLSWTKTAGSRLVSNV